MLPGAAPRPGNKALSPYLHGHIPTWFLQYRKSAAVRGRGKRVGAPSGTPCEASPKQRPGEMVQPLSVNTAVTEDPSSVPRSPKQKGAWKPHSHSEVSQSARNAVWLMDTGVFLSCLHTWRLSSDSAVSQVRKQAPGSEFIFLFLLGQNQPQSYKCDTRGWVAERLSSVDRWQKSRFLTLQRGTVPALRGTASVI